MRISVTVIPLKIVNNKIKVMMQKRLNQREKSWIGMWEFPQGKIEDFNFAYYAQKELVNEAGITLDYLCIGTKENKCNSSFNGNVFSFEPFCTVKVKEHLNFHFLSLVYGKERETKEADTQTWFDFNQIKDILLGNKICPINRPALEKMIAAGRKNIISIIENNSTLKLKLNCPVVAVDLGGIIIKWNDDSLVSNLCQLYQCNYKEMYQFLIEDKNRHELHTGSIGHKELWKKLNERFVPALYDVYFKAWEKSVEIIEDNFKTIKRIKDTFPAVTFVIASNIDAITESILETALELDQVFEFRFMSWRMEKSKPDLEFYSDIYTVCGSPKILLIDDRVQNLSAAVKAGFEVYGHHANELLDYEKLKKNIEIWLTED